MNRFSQYKMKDVTLKNRIVMPPMCMYSADESGKMNAFHHTHYVTRAMGGVGLIIVEATGVVPNGRISEFDLGLWNKEQMESFKKTVAEVKSYGAKIGIQLGHAGRKYIGQSMEAVAPSPIPFDEKSRVPLELSKEGIQDLIGKFVQAAKYADEAGFDTVEIHSAHGYLIHEFLSPITNQRTDEYGGDIDGRVKFLKEICQNIRKSLPEGKPLLLRVSASDYHESGLKPEDMVDIINKVKEYVDMVHVSSGGLINVPMKVYPGYQIGLAQLIKESCGIDTIAVGKITSVEMIEEILGNKRSDLVALGREHLRNPYFTLNTMSKDEISKEGIIPEQYLRGF